MGCRSGRRFSSGVASSAASSAAPKLMLSLSSAAVRRQPRRFDECAGAHRARPEAAAFLHYPGHHLDRPQRLDAGVVQRGKQLQPGDHAIGAVELAAHRLGVGMAAGQHRRQRRPAAPAEKQVRAVVGLDLAAERAGAGDQVPPRIEIGLRQRLARDAAVIAPAELREGRERVVQPLRLTCARTVSGAPPFDSCCPVM